MEAWIADFRGDVLPYSPPLEARHPRLTPPEKSRIAGRAEILRFWPLHRAFLHEKGLDPPSRCAQNQERSHFKHIMSGDLHDIP